MSALGTVLVVDDEKGMRDMLRHEFGRKGYRVETAENGRLALERLRAGGIDAIVSDLKMPELDGQRLLEEVKKIDPDLQVILVTGYATVDIAVAAIKLGAYGLLQKPFDVEELSLLIEKALEKREFKKVSAVYEASREILRARRLDDLLPRVAAPLMRACRADGAAVALLENGRLTLAACAGAAPAEGWDARLARKEAGGAAPSTVARTELIVDGATVGALFCSRANADDPFDAASFRLMSIFSAQVALAVQNALAFQRLEETQKRLAQSEKVNALGRLAAGVAHEINNPLTAILGLAHLLAEQESLNASQRTDVRGIIVQSERCRTIAEDLLLFGRKQDKKEPLPVLDALKSALRLSRLDIVTRRLSVTLREPDAAHAVCADSGKLQQVFLNLIANAAHATEGRDERRLDIRVEADGERIRILFADNGCGMEPKSLARIFEPFFTTKEAGKGTGLGLSICRDIVQEHGGTISATSVPGTGSVFVVALPRLEFARLASAASRAPSRA